MKRLFVFVVILAMLLAVAPNQPTLAQNSISYGDTVQGELTNSATKISYTFEGKRGDIAVVQMIAGVSNGAIGAQLNVTDSNATKLADSAALIIFGRLGEIVVVEVPSDGSYTINVESGSSGTTGTFDLVLLQAEFLELNSPVEGEAKSAGDDQRERYTNFYVVESRSDVELRYERVSGNYAPTMIVLSVEGGNNLFERAFLGGSLLTKGSITLEGSRDFRLVTVGSFNFGGSGRGTVQTSTFRLTLANAE